MTHEPKTIEGSRARVRCPFLVTQSLEISCGSHGMPSPPLLLRSRCAFPSGTWLSQGFLSICIAYFYELRVEVRELPSRTVATEHCWKVCCVGVALELRDQFLFTGPRTVLFCFFHWETPFAVLTDTLAGACVYWYRCMIYKTKLPGIVPFLPQPPACFPS